MEVFILELVLSSKNITLEDLINVTRRGYKVSISKEAYEKIDKARALVDNLSLILYIDYKRFSKILIIYFINNYHKYNKF